MKTNQNESTATVNDWEREEAEARRFMFTLLNEAQFDRVEVRFDGYGDSGQIDVMMLSRQGSQVPVAVVKQEIKDAIVDYVFTKLPDGWGIDAGSYGTVRIYPASEYAEFSVTKRHEEHDTFSDGIPGPDVPEQERFVEYVCQGQVIATLCSDEQKQSIRRAIFDMLKKDGCAEVNSMYKVVGNRLSIADINYDRGDDCDSENEVPSEVKDAIMNYIFTHTPTGVHLTKFVGEVWIYPTSEYAYFNCEYLTTGIHSFADGVPGDEVPKHRTKSSTWALI